MAKKPFNVSIFGKYANKGNQYRDSPTGVPASRADVDYNVQRQNGAIPSPNVFQDTGYENNDPNVIALDLSVSRTDFQFNTGGNLFWYQSSTNASDIVKVKYNKTSSVAIPFQPGNKLGGVPFTQLFITNAATAGATAIIILLKDSPASPISVL